MLHLTPLHDHIWVQPDSAEKKTPGGIVLPEASQEKPRRGIIKAHGPGRRNEVGQRIGLDVHVGDRVIFSAYAGTTIKVDGVDVFLLNERDIWAIVHAAAPDPDELRQRFSDGYEEAAQLSFASAAITKPAPDEPAEA